MIIDDTYIDNKEIKYMTFKKNKSDEQYAEVNTYCGTIIAIYCTKEAYEKGLNVLKAYQLLNGRMTDQGRKDGNPVSP